MLATTREFRRDELERLALRLDGLGTSSISFEKLERLLERGKTDTFAIAPASEQRQEDRAQESLSLIHI